VGDDTGGGAEALAQILKSGKMAKKNTGHRLIETWPVEKVGRQRARSTLLLKL
jgi:hypothetical protein